jgi:hypothetical protein
MKNVAIIIAIFTVCMVSDLVAFTPNQYLNVTANSGLNMRLTPVNGTVIHKLKLGDRVEMLEDIDCLGFKQRIDWVDGEWIRVQHDELIGYVFSGYLSTLPVPLSEGEYTSVPTIQMAFETWIENNFSPQAANDTVLGSNIIEACKKYDNGLVLKKTTTSHNTLLTATFSDAKVMELYHICFAMLVNKSDQKYFLDNSTFQENTEGSIHKINISNPNELIKIAKQKDGSSKIEINFSSFEGC